MKDEVKDVMEDVVEVYAQEKGWHGEVDGGQRKVLPLSLSGGG